MKITTMKKILSKVYEIDCKMDEVIDGLDDPTVHNGDEKKVLMLEKEHDRLCAILHGMSITLEYLGYDLTDSGDGCWRIVPKT